MNVLVTGGGGFLGSTIVRMLRERGDTIRSFSRRTYPTLETLGVEQMTGDLTDMAALGRAVTGCDMVYHVAAKAGVWGDYADYYSANVIGTRNVLAACRKHGIGQLVYTSSPSVTFAGTDQEGADESEPYPARFLAHYPATKAVAEREVLAANGPDLATVALRPHLIWGKGDPHLAPRLLRQARKRRLMRIGTRPNLVDTTYIDNAAVAHVLAGERLQPGSPVAGKAYFIANDEPMPLWDFINQLLDVYGMPPVKRAVPAWFAYGAGAILEVAYRVLGIRIREPRVSRFVVRQLSTSHWFDLSAAKRDLGYRPIVTVEEGLARLRADMQS